MIDFYTSILGFVVCEQNKLWGWKSLFKDEREIMLASVFTLLSLKRRGFAEKAFTLKVLQAQRQKMFTQLTQNEKYTYPCYCNMNKL